jgi:hypothetical protein
MTDYHAEVASVRGDTSDVDLARNEKLQQVPVLSNLTGESRVLRGLFLLASDGQGAGFPGASGEHRSRGFITIPAPLHDYVLPRDPMSSPPFCATQGGYFTRMSVKFIPSTPAFRESRWIASEDPNALALDRRVGYCVCGWFAYP